MTHHEKRGQKRVRVALTSEPAEGEQGNPGKIPWIMGCSDEIFSPTDALSWILKKESVSHGRVGRISGTLYITVSVKQ